MHERIEGLRRSVASVSQIMLAPKNWIGSEDVNLFQIVCETLEVLEEINAQLATHTHGPSPVPGNAAAFASARTIAARLRATVEPIVM